MLDQGLAGASRAKHHVEYASGNSNLMDDVRKRRGSDGCWICWFHYDRVAKRQRGSRLPRRDGDREVPRRNQPEHTNCLARGGHIDAGTGRGEVLPMAAQRLAGEVFENPPFPRDLADSLGEGLTLFP